MNCLPSESSVSIKGNALGNVKYYEYLRISLDYSLSFEEAVNETYLKANRKIYTLNRIGHTLHHLWRVSFISKFVLPLLDYADFLFDSAPKMATDQLDKLQR